MRNILASDAAPNAAFNAMLSQQSSIIPDQIANPDGLDVTKPASDDSEQSAPPTILGSRSQPRGFRKSLFRS